jgi:dihydrofolate reductase
MITLIAACSSNLVIGKDNKLIWKVPGDLKRFKDITTGHKIVMGRKTFESIGKALPNRTNIILSKQKNLKIDGCLIYNNVYEILSLFEKENIFVIGGGEIYKQFLPFAQKIELTYIHKYFEGDAFFPKINEIDWQISNKIEMSCEDFKYDFITFTRIA